MTTKPTLNEPFVLDEVLKSRRLEDISGADAMLSVPDVSERGEISAAANWSKIRIDEANRHTTFSFKGFSNTVMESEIDESRREEGTVASACKLSYKIT